MSPQSSPASASREPRPAIAASGVEDGGPDPLARLRERVERAAQEIERLRAENRQLAQRVDDLASADSSTMDKHPAAVAIAGDPEHLKEKIQGFIDALDRVLAERSALPAALLHGEDQHDTEEASPATD
jgi:seryl-tRNA synthetase